MRDVYLGLRGNFIRLFFYRRIFIHAIRVNTRVHTGIRARMRDR
jgi:hypothetical protein